MRPETIISACKDYNQGTVGMTLVFIHTYIHNLILLNESVFSQTHLWHLKEALFCTYGSQVSLQCPS